MRRIVSVLVLALLVMSAVPAFAQDEESNTIADIVVASATGETPEFATLLTAVQAADPAVLEALANPEAELTVFAPTDAAFAALAEALGEEAFGEILADPAALTEILLYHVVDGVIVSGDVVAALSEGEADDMGTVAAAVTTLSDQFVEVTGTITEGELDLEAGIFIDEAGLILEMVDIEADNGVIHVIDAVLVPELDTIADIVIASATTEEDAEFTTLLAAVQAADPAVVELLSDSSAALTVFAPTDAAFAAVEGLEDIVADTELLTAILSYHVFPGVVYSFDIPELLDDMGAVEIEMADGSAATIAVTEEGVFINEAEVIITDIEASNGTIHVIDAVIVPMMEEEAASTGY